MTPRTGTATILVTDLANSTALRSTLGEQAADGLRREHDRLLGEVVASHRGRVVKSTGDGLLATFDSASDGVAAAVAMQEAVESLGRRRRLVLAIRVGLSAGDVSWENDDCFGLPVVEAARLESAAEPGQILCAELVRVLARGRAGAEFRSVGSLSLKGLPEPVAACEVLWSPAAPAERAGSRCVGRDRELEALGAAGAQARRGEGGAVLVAGEPGIGKTRLLTEFAGVVAADGAVVWWGASYEGDDRAYGAFGMMLDDYARVIRPDTLREQMGSRAGLVARVAPGVRTVLGEMADAGFVASEAERERTEDAVVDLAVAVAADAPLLVVVDDAHWADPATVSLVRVLVRRAARHRVLVVVAYREIDLDRQHPLAGALPGLRREPYVRRVVLGGLDADGVRDLLEDLAAHELPAEFGEVLRAETGGNPFFVREVVRNLVEEGRVRREQGRWVADPIASLRLPEGVREVIGRRLSRLSGDANRLLGVAAAFEAGFDLGDTAAVAGLSEDAALDAIDEALAAQIVTAADGFDRYRFTHALFRHTLWSEWNPSRQVRLHRAIADRLEKRCDHRPSPSEALVLARHFHRSAALPGHERGVAYALVAADDAASRYAATEELAAIEIALDLVVDGDDAVAALSARAARAAVLAGLHRSAGLDHARRAVDATARQDGPAAAAQLAVELGRLSFDVETHSGWPYGRLAAPHAADLDEAGEVAVQLLAWEIEEAEFLDPDNPGIAVESPARERLRVLAERLPSHQRPSAYLPPTGAEAVDADGWPIWKLAFDGPGRYREAATWMRAAADHLLVTGPRSRAVIVLGVLARVLLVLGDLDAAAAVRREGKALLPGLDPDSNAVVQFQAAQQFYEYYFGQEDRGFIESVVVDRADLRWLSGVLALTSALRTAKHGDTESALDAVGRHLAVITRGAVGAPNYVMGVAVAAATLFEADSDRYADVIERNLHAKVLAPDFHYPEYDGRWSAAQLCAVTGRPAEARVWFQRAYDRLTEQGAVLLLPHVAYDEALMEARLGADGDRVNGLRRLDEARAWAQRIGLPSLGARLDDLAARLRA